MYGLFLYLKLISYFSLFCLLYRYQESIYLI